MSSKGHLRRLWEFLLPVSLLARCLLAFQLNESILLPDGFEIHSYTNASILKARTLVLSPNSNDQRTVLYVSTRNGTSVYAVIDDNGNGVADRVVEVVVDRRSPNGIAWRDGSLFVATPNEVLRYDDVDAKAIDGERFDEPVVVRDGFPNGEHHFWRYSAFGPDDKLYISIGSMCNLCPAQENGTMTDATIVRMNPDGSELELFASGVRNSVGFDWHPETGEFFFTENGADLLGNDFPDDLLYRASRQGLHFGYPCLHIEGIGDPYSRQPGEHRFARDENFGRGCRGRGRVKPVQALGPHVAALGMRFYTGEMFPEQYKNSIFVAEHGSWDRDKKIGFRIVNIRLGEDHQTAVQHDVFAEGWVQDEETMGRPVDVQMLPDGSLLVSDDSANDIYRIVYSEST